MPDSPVADSKIVLGGKPLSSRAASYLVDVTVLQDVDAPDMFELRLVNWDPDDLDVTWSDDKLFALGSEVEVQMGYVGELAPVMVGEITGIEPEFSASEVPMVTIRGHDLSHRLLRGRHTRTFAKMKDSDIAGRIGREAKISTKAVDTEVKLEYVLQHNQTDMEFLRDRAAQIGYEIVVEKKSLHFRPPPLSQKPSVVLDRTDGLIDFFPRLTTMSLPSEVEVRGWDSDTKKPVVGRAGSADVSERMGGDALGSAAGSKAFGPAVATTTDRAVSKEPDARRLAQGVMRRSALGHVVGDGTAVGTPALRAGSVVKIEGVGKRFSGEYYVATATHSYRPRRGYVTGFSVRRTAT